MLCLPLAYGAPSSASFPRRSVLAPQSSRRRAPPARSCCVSRSPTGRLQAPPSLVARSSLLRPVGAAPLLLAHAVSPARLRGAFRRLLPSSLVPRSSVQSAPRPSGSLMLCLPLAYGAPSGAPFAQRPVGGQWRTRRAPPPSP